MAEAISEALRQTIVGRAGGCCEYCRSPQDYATERFSIEHIHPRRLGGLTVPDNLALSCQGCNGHKAAKTTALDPETNEKVALFHPRHQVWQQHFVWSEDGLQIIGLTAIGRATLISLQLNRPSLMNLRRALIAVNVHPPLDEI